MRFPVYVPNSVHGFFLAEVERLAPLIEKAQHKLVGIERLIDQWPKLCELCKLKNSQESLTRRQASAVIARDCLVNRMDYIRRLAGVARDDERMQDAYDALRKEFTIDGQWLRFVYAAYSSMHDYAEYRQRRKRATQLSQQVANEAVTLARSLRQLQETGVVLPLELRDHRRSCSTYEGMSEIEFDLMIRHIVRTICSPKHTDLTMLLYEAAKAARTVCFSFDAADGAVDAAISKQKPNLKTEYLRAFGHLLTNEEGTVGQPIALKPGVRRAMAVTSTVAINSDVIVTDDDVRKALELSEVSLPKKDRNLPSARKISGG